jgi:hypothetical protein
VDDPGSDFLSRSRPLASGLRYIEHLLNILPGDMRMNIVDLVQQHLGPQEIQQISKQLEVDPSSTQNAVQAAVPLMVGGIANTADQPAGATTIQSLLGSHSGMLDNVGSVLSAGAPADGGGLLGKILGQHQQTVQQGVQQASGLQPDQTRKLLMILGPIVLAALARRHSQAAAAATNAAPGAATDTSLAGALRQDAQAAQAKAPSPHVGGLLGKILSHVETPRA